MNNSIVQAELQQCRTLLTDLCRHDNPLLGRALTTILGRSGKMMRPILVLLSAKLFGGINGGTLNVAAAYEAFHTASLVHDDVVDESDERRGQDSLNYAEGNKVAVLVGDYILASALKFLADTHDTRLVDILSSAAQGLSNGELLQLLNISNTDLSETTYYDIIRNKTAVLFSACARSGAITAGAGEDDVENMGLFGEYVGMCFQIKDDIFDNLTDDIGKPTGNDLREGKITLPTIYALTHSATDCSDMVRKIKDRSATEDDIQQVLDFTRQHRGIEYATQVMHGYADKACGLLDKYKDNEVTRALREYVDYVVGRTY